MACFGWFRALCAWCVFWADGTAAPFLDTALQCVRDGGLLCVTCTDMASLCGTGGEAGFAKYGAYPLRGPFCHEQALRLLLGCILTHAARHKKYIVPLVSLSIDFYVRVFVRVYSSALVVKQSASKLAHLHACTGCDEFLLQRVGKLHSVAAADPSRPPRLKYSAGTSNVAVPSLCVHCESPFQVR